MKMVKNYKIYFFLGLIIPHFSCVQQEQCARYQEPKNNYDIPEDVVGKTDFFAKLADSAISLTKDDVVYDATYFSIKYPNGDVPANKGVCCDVVIRAYRKLGIDLQQVVHEDMANNFAKYPRKWGLLKTDKNIDHRRVPNLMTYFERQQANLPITTNSADYVEGDIVCWDLGKGLTLIGIVIEKKYTDGTKKLIVHNIGAGQEISDCLFSFKIIGHYRYNQKK